MPDEFSNDHDAIVTLVSETRSFRVQTTKDIDELKKGIANLQTAFVPQSVFDQLSVIVRGIANSGGLQQRVADLEDTRTYQKGAFSAVHWVGIVIGSLLTLSIAWAGYNLQKIQMPQNIPTQTIINK